LSFAGDNEVYLWSNEQSNTSGIYKYNLETTSSELIYKHEKVDITSIFYSGSGEPIAVRIDIDKPSIYFLNKKHIFSRWLFSLQDRFPGQYLSLKSATKNDDKFILEVSSDTNPGDFYLVDTIKEKVNFLLSRRPFLQKESLMPMHAITFLARDNLQLNGYITLPKNVDESTPLVVYPHGGPHGVRDYWGFQSDVQFLASQGIAVLQVNYRGSDGYGKKFAGAGLKEWGGKMVTDVIDATIWSQKKYKLSKNNICIMGGSYGAFSALMAATIEPDLYKCVVLEAGVYDLVAMTGSETSWIAKKYFEDILGKNESILNKQSPINYLHKLKAPIFLMHGKRDNIAKFEQAEELVAALQKEGKDVKWHYFKKEGHGWLGFNNRVEAYKKTSKFIFESLEQ
jgi:dipeptidyl aminopeptidase/acylaminoacyl peptidase